MSFREYRHALQAACILIVLAGCGVALAQSEVAIPQHALADVRAMCLRNVAAPPTQAQAYCTCFVDELGKTVGLEAFLSFSGKGLAEGQNADFSTLIRIAQACRHYAMPPQ